MRLKTITSILSLAFVLASCTREDLSDCIETGATISFRYEWAGSVTSNLPMRRADLYLFDSDRRFVYSLTDSIGPFTTSRTYKIPLPAGRYTAVAWGNKDGVYQVNPAVFTPNVTTLDQAQLILKGISSASRSSDETTVKGPSTPLFHAIKHDILIEEQKNTTTVMELLRNTKEINLSVTFTHRDGTLCDDVKNRCTPTIRSNDGIHNFENSRLQCPDFLYVPTTNNNKEGGYDALFNKTRLQLNEESQIILTKLPESGSQEIFYQEKLMKWIVGVGYNTQEKIDATHIYNIELNFICDDNSTHVTVQIKVNGWVYVDNSDEV